MVVGNGADWVGKPHRIAPAFLRWALVWGPSADGRTLWQLACEATNDPEVYWLDVPDRPSADELFQAMVPIVGRPIAETLIDASVGDPED